MRLIGRMSHTAVWTGNEMIVWGGNGDSGVLDTGGRYDPVTNSWTDDEHCQRAQVSRAGHSGSLD